MLDLGLYRKLAEVVTRKEINQTYFAYKAIGSLREACEARLKT